MGCGCGKGKPANIRSQTVVPKAPASRSVTPQKIERGSCRRCGSPTMVVIVSHRERSQCVSCNLIQ
jgi:ribosomal protein S27AE